MTPKTSDQILVEFWHQINPWGFWGRYIAEAEKQGLVKEKGILERLLEKMNDMVSLAFALPFQIALLLGAMAFVFHDWKKFSFFAVVLVISATGLYFFWYRNLKSTEICEQEDEYFDRKHGKIPDEPANETDKAAA